MRRQLQPAQCLVKTRRKKAGLRISAERFRNLGNNVNPLPIECGLLCIELGCAGQVFVLRNRLCRIENGGDRFTVMIFVAIMFEKGAELFNFIKKKIEIAAIADK